MSLSAPAPAPTLDDYVALFRLYGDGLGVAYLDEAGHRYDLLFAQVVRLLVRPSSFNLSLPPPFRDAAAQYLAGDPGMVRKLDDPEVRHFMLSDLFDFIDLKRRLEARGRSA